MNERMSNKSMFKRKKSLNIQFNVDTFPKCKVIGTFTGYSIEIQDVEHMQKLYCEVSLSFLFKDFSQNFKIQKL